MQVMKEIVAGQLIPTVARPFMQPQPTVGESQEGNGRGVPSDNPLANREVVSAPSQPSSSDEPAAAQPKLSEHSLAGQSGTDGEALTREELAQLAELKKRDRMVRAHEQAHMTAAAGIVIRGMSFSYQKGPDGKRYAVGGEVQIDAGKEATPAETIEKMEKVQAAALAPVDPSPQDRRVAASAMTKLSQARIELRAEQAKEIKEQREATADEQTLTTVSSRSRNAAAGYLSSSDQLRRSTISIEV